VRCGAIDAVRSMCGRGGCFMCFHTRVRSSRSLVGGRSSVLCRITNFDHPSVTTPRALACELCQMPKSSTWPGARTSLASDPSRLVAGRLMLLSDRKSTFVFQRLRSNLVVCSPFARYNCRLNRVTSRPTACDRIYFRAS
jgi:hypothetical protein